VCEAVKHVNKLLRSKQFYERISSHPRFDRADINPATVAMLMQKSAIEMKIEFYFSRRRGTAWGYDDKQRPDTIHLNVWNLERPVPSLCNQMVHSCIHAVNAENPQFSFDHDEPGNHALENAAPNWIGCLAEKMISGDETRSEIMQHETDHDIFAIFECLVLPVS
jgi:hypothetical protein